MGYAGAASAGIFPESGWRLERYAAAAAWRGAGAKSQVSSDRLGSNTKHRSGDPVSGRVRYQPSDITGGGGGSRFLATGQLRCHGGHIADQLELFRESASRASLD